MSRFRLGLLTLTLLTALHSGFASPVRADQYRQYYGNWTYHPQYNYYYCHYYYKPAPTYTTYSHHYCICRPSQPRYVYYYNPHRRVYWGRLDLEGRPGAQYSLLEEKDRKGSLNEIPESAFPTPGAMPRIPDAEDQVAIEPPAAGPPLDRPASKP